MYFRGIAADSKFQGKMKGYLFSEGYLFTGFYGILLHSMIIFGPSFLFFFFIKKNECQKSNREDNPEIEQRQTQVHGRKNEKKSTSLDEDGIRTHACRAQWISSPSP